MPYDRMGTYLTVLDNSQYFTSEASVSAFSIITAMKSDKGEVGIPITFTANNFTDIQKRIGMPIFNTNDTDSNNKEWWAFYEGFKYSKPLSVFRVIHSNFKNPAVRLAVASTGSESIYHKTVDGQIVNVVVPSIGSLTETSDTSIIVENSEVATIRMENVTLAVTDLGVGVYKYSGLNTSNISYVVLNKLALTSTLTITVPSYLATLSASITVSTGGVVDGITIINAGSGYSAGLLSFTVYKSDGVTPSSGVGLILSYTYGANGEILTIGLTDGGYNYESNAVIKFYVNEGTLVSLKYPQYSYVADLFDFVLEDDENVLIVFEDGVLVEKFLFNGNSTSDKYWNNVIKSDYGYWKFNDAVLNSSGYKTVAYATYVTSATSGMCEFAGKGVGVMSDVTFADYLTTLDYISGQELENSVVSDGAIPAIFSKAETKQYHQKLVSTVAPAIYGFITMSFPISVENTFVGKLNVTESDLNEYVDYKNSLGYNSDELGYYGAVYAPSLKKVFDVFNNKNIWIPISTDMAGGLTRLNGNYQYSPVETRGQFGFDDLIWKIKKNNLEGYLYKNGVNPLIIRNGQYILKGHKTLTTKNTAFNRINVARTVSIFKIEARDLGNQFVGELGLPETRIQVSDVYTRFINRYISGNKLVDAKVVCDDTNNTSVDLDNNTMNIDIYIKPVKVYDFVQITIVVLPQSAIIK